MKRPQYHTDCHNDTHAYLHQISTSTHTSSTTTMAASSASPTCLGDDGQIFKGQNYNFKIKCDIDRRGNDLSNRNVNTFTKYLDMCDSNPACTGVSWIPGTPGPCYLHDAAATPSTLSYIRGAIRVDQLTVMLSSSVTSSASSSSSSVATPSTP